jgi:hypothetical protein
MLVIPLEVVMGWAWFCGKSRPHNLRRASTTMLSHGFLRVCSNCQSSCVKHIITDIEIHCKLWIPNFFSLEHWKQRQMNSANLNKSYGMWYQQGANCGPQKQSFLFYWVLWRPLYALVIYRSKPNFILFEGCTSSEVQCTGHVTLASGSALTFGGYPPL